MVGRPDACATYLVINDELQFRICAKAPWRGPMGYGETTLSKLPVTATRMLAKPLAHFDTARIIVCR